MCNLPSLPGSPVCSVPTCLLAAAWFLSGPWECFLVYHQPLQNQAQMWKTQGQSRESLIDGVMSSSTLKKTAWRALAQDVSFSFFPLERGVYNR